jgi:hypothetical protein
MEHLYGKGRFKKMMGMHLRILIRMMNSWCHWLNAFAEFIFVPQEHFTDSQKSPAVHLTSLAIHEFD